MGDGRDEGREPEYDGDHVDVVALVLGDVDGQRRAEMAAHLLGCRVCRRDYDEVAATVGELLPAGPAVQPAIGFDEQVLLRMGVGPSSGSGRGTRSRRRWAWLAGAAAVVVVGLAVGLTVAGDDDPVADGAVIALEKVDGGDAVGTVSLADVDDATVMVVALVDAPDGVSYLCRTTFADGTTTDSEAWPPGNGAWIVPLPAGPVDDVRTVELIVDGTDHVWSTASFDDGAT